MGNLEALASSGNLLHTALEARAALADVNLLHTLQDLGHPYGLMLSSAQSSQSSQVSYERKLDISWLPSDWYSNEINASSGSYSSFWHSLSLGMCSASSEQLLDVAVFWSATGSPTPPESMPEKKLKSDTRKFSINKSHLALGTVSLNLTQFKGQESYVIKSPQGEPVTEIQPGSPLAFLHLNRQAAEMCQMSPLERIQTMTHDLKEAFNLIDNEALFNSLNPEQQAVLTAAKSAVIVGISHLVPIFHRITNFPTWKLDVLPLAVRKFHRFDSQAVSNQFGGKRQVKVEDIEMTVITPQMRRQLIVTV